MKAAIWRTIFSAWLLGVACMIGWHPRYEEDGIFAALIGFGAGMWCILAMDRWREWRRDRG